jgi:tRNA pseudouridine38-40 synthase
VPRFKLTIEYAGTRYSGWQIQKNARTIQGELERAIQTATRERGFELYGSGRTDAGVHALLQVAHLQLSTSPAPDLLIRRVNDELPSDINVLTIQKVAQRFHARHDAVARSYVYQICRRRTAFGKAFVWWIREPIDVARMRGVADQFVGLKDFQSFTDDDPNDKSTRVQVDGIELEEAGAFVLIRIEGSHFIWKMVRRLVGVLAEVGRGTLSPEEASSFLRERSPTPARLTAPASGLFLERVFYPGDRREYPLRPLLNLVD